MLESVSNRLVFLDESGVNIHMTRHYARAQSAERAQEGVPLNTPRSTTILSSIRSDGTTQHIAYSGGTTAERFRDYLKDVLLPTLHKEDIVIMDNMRSHHSKIVTETLEKAGIHYRYLPPYSPDLNPIEKMWSKLKAFLRKTKARAKEQLSQAIQAAFQTIRCSDCIAWFRSCGYMH